jgi:hypothetical protein
MTKVSFVTIPSAIVTQKFNNYNPTMYGGDRRHKGIDFGIVAGNPVYACMGGEVTTAVVSQSGYGRHVRITHPDNSMSIYGHLSKLLVNVGDVVGAGQEIGKSGGDPSDGIDGDGFSTGAHLHFEIRPPNSLTSDQGAVDPVAWCAKYIPGVRKQSEVTSYEGLRARSAPVSGNILYVMPHRTIIDVVEEKDGWSRILGLRPEWCSSTYLNFTGIETNPDIPDDEIPEDIYTDKEKLDILWKLYLETH